MILLRRRNSSGGILVARVYVSKSNYSLNIQSVYPQKINEGDIGGYPIPQYRKKKWQIPKYRVENRLNTDTAYFNHIYNRFRILMVASMWSV